MPAAMGWMAMSALRMWRVTSIALRRSRDWKHRGDCILVSSRLVALDSVSIALLDNPSLAFERDIVPTLDELLASASGPDPDGGVDLTDDEFANFLEAASA